MKPTGMAAVIIVLIANVPAHAQERSFLDRLFRSGIDSSLPEAKIRDGLREALTVGIDKTIKLVGREDGYYKDEKIKILLPRPVRRWEGALRATGFGPQLDEFELSMNRAAEAAAPVAKDVFVNAIAGMEIEDAERILRGDDTEATDYLKKTTSGELTEKFTPIMRKTMAEYGVVQKFNEVSERFGSVALLRRSLNVDIEEYAVEHALDGLFYVLGQQEKKIREDPAARATELLRDVFGNR